MSAIKEIIGLMTFTPWVTKDTRMGPRLIRTAQLTNPFVHKQFWASWNKDRSAWYELGYGVSKAEGWILGQYLNPDGTVTAQALEMAAKAREEKGEGALPADWIPNDVTLGTPQAEKLLGYQRPAAMRLKRALGAGNALDASDTGCHARGTMILMANGKRRPVEQIIPGCEVMGWDGTSRVVQGIARGQEEMARIVPTKGEPFVVNISHILTLKYTHASPDSGMGKFSGKVIDITVREYLALNPTHRHCLKLFRMPVATWPAAELDIDPYHLGVMLGDGCMTTKCALSLTKPGAEMEAVAYELAAAHGASVTTSQRSENNPTHRITSGSLLWSKLDWIALAG